MQSSEPRPWCAQLGRSLWLLCVIQVNVKAPSETTYLTYDNKPTEDYGRNHKNIFDIEHDFTLLDSNNKPAWFWGAEHCWHQRHQGNFFIYDQDCCYKPSELFRLSFSLKQDQLYLLSSSISRVILSEPIFKLGGLNLSILISAIYPVVILGLSVSWASKCWLCLCTTHLVSQAVAAYEWLHLHPYYLISLYSQWVGWIALIFVLFLSQIMWWYLLFKIYWLGFVFTIIKGKRICARKLEILSYDSSGHIPVLTNLSNTSI